MRQLRETTMAPSLARDVLSAALMLRSIIAIWCIALGLVFIAATSGCSLGGCANGDDCSGPVSHPPDMAYPPAAQCATTCPACVTGETCFQPPFSAQLPTFCARTCTSDGDCKTGETCAALFASLQPAVCISAGSPKGCGTTPVGWHCDLAPASCKDANTLQKPFTHVDDLVCGWELVHCANGC